MRAAAPLTAIVGLGVLALAGVWLTGIRGAAGWAPWFLRGYAVAWAAYVAAGVVLGSGKRWPRWVLIWVVVCALGLRLVALARTPPLSTDVWRYLWDGRVANAGINPFRHAPNSPQLGHLRDDNWRRINYRRIPTIYPPVAQMLFQGLARVRDRDAEAFRWAFALFDLGSVVLIAALLQRTGRPAVRAVWYAWCPLAVTESTAGAHVDSVGLFLLLVALLLVARETGKPGLAGGVALAGAAMAKGFAALAAPLVLRRGGWRGAAAFGLTCAALLLPYLGAGTRLFRGLRAYAEGWETNASVFLVIDRFLQRYTADHFIITRGLTTAAVLAVVAVLAWRLRPGTEPLVAASFTAVGAQLLIGAPTLPWYVIWVVPALCWWTIPGLALLTLTVSAQYYARWLYPDDKAAHEALLWAGYVPVYALLLGQWVYGRRRRGRSERAMGASAGAGERSTG